MSTRNVQRALAWLAAGLAVALGWSLSRAPSAPSGAAPGRPTAEVIWDTHPDPDVGRVLRQALAVRLPDETSLRTSHWGMRERDWFLDPTGPVRILLVGDELVMGAGVETEQRLGQHLESFLQERAGIPIEIEVMHFGIGGWNVQAASAFTRRTLFHLSPALVIQIPIAPDVGDVRGARGFGGVAHFSPQARQRATGFLSSTTTFDAGWASTPNHLAAGLCWESRQRYAALAEHVSALSDGVRRSGGAYLMLLGWTGFQPIALESVEPVLEGPQLALLPDTFVAQHSALDPRGYRTWDPDAHKELAKLLYGLIQQRNLLPSLQLTAWDEADALLQANADASAAQSPESTPSAQLELHSEIDIERLDATMAPQVYGGIDGPYAAPYVSLLFPGTNASELVVRGRRMGRPELRGMTRVFVEEFEVGSWSLVGELSIRDRFPLPTALADRRFLNVRFVSDDYVYPRPNVCASFELESVAVQ